MGPNTRDCRNFEGDGILICLEGLDVNGNYAGASHPICESIDSAVSWLGFM